jgi:hypothetical protein
MNLFSKISKWLRGDPDGSPEGRDSTGTPPDKHDLEAGATTAEPVAVPARSYARAEVAQKPSAAPVKPTQRKGAGKKGTLSARETRPAPVKVPDDNLRPSDEARRAEAEAKHQKRRLKREIKDQLYALNQSGDACEARAIATFVLHYQGERVALTEVLHETARLSSFPVQMIREYVFQGTSQELEQHIEEERLRRAVSSQVESLRNRLPPVLQLDVDLTESGPDFNAVTLVSLKALINRYNDDLALSYAVWAELPFTRLGNYTIRVDFMRGISFTQAVVLRVPAHEIPQELRGELEPPLTLPSNDDESIYEYLVREYAHPAKMELSELFWLLKALYHYGYGRTTWAAQVREEWYRKREYASLIADRDQISNLITTLNQSGGIALSERDVADLTSDKVLQIATNALKGHDVFTRRTVKMEPSGALTGPVIKVKLSLMDNLVGDLELYRPGVPRPQRTPEASGPVVVVPKGLEQLLNKVLATSQSPRRITVASAIDTDINKAIAQVKRDVSQCDTTTLELEDLPHGLSELMHEARRKTQTPPGERARRFLKLARYHAENDHEEELRFCLAEYCSLYVQGRTSTARRESRPYLLCFFLLHYRFTSEIERDYKYTFYYNLAVHFGTYNIPIDITNSVPLNIDEKFDSSLTAFLENGAYQKEGHLVGRCFLELNATNSKFVADFINRLQNRKQTKALNGLVHALQHQQVVRADPYLCFQLLGRINPQALAGSVRNLNLGSVEQRRLVTIALVSYARSDEQKLIDYQFAALMTPDARKDLVFSLFVERLIFGGEAEKESALKARLIATALGLAPGTRESEFTLISSAELVRLFDRFENTNEADARYEIAFTILRKIASLRKRLLGEFSLRPEPAEAIRQFTRSLEGHVSSEQNKLIREASLELALITKRAAHAISTRVTVEIRYTGANEGIVENLVLAVKPVPGAYNVEERYLTYPIDTVGQRPPLQREIFIQPLVADTSSVDLDISITYDTLTDKGKVRNLPEHDRTVYLYPAGEFVRIPSVYNISEPATIWFYGRRAQLEGMADKLRSGSDHDTSMMIYGLKRTGKTSLIKRFLSHTLAERGFTSSHISVELDLLKDRWFYTRMRNSDLLHWLAGMIVQRLGEQGIPGAGDLQIDATSFQRDPYTSFNTTIRAALRLLEGRRMIVALDEFSELHSHFKQPDDEGGLTQEVFSFLSNVIQSTPELTFIFAGTYVLLRMNRQETFDLTKICLPQLVSFLDEPSARRLVEEPVKPNAERPELGWLEYGRGVIDRIVNVTNCHPYFIQYLCMLLVERMNAINHNTANRLDIETVITDFVYKPAHNTVIHQLWNEFEPVQHKLLAVLAHRATGENPWITLDEVEETFREYGEQITPRDLLSVCNSLSDAEMLMRSTTTGESVEVYRLSIPLFALWLRQNKQLNEVFDGERLVMTID